MRNETPLNTILISVFSAWVRLINDVIDEDKLTLQTLTMRNCARDFRAISAVFAVKSQALLLVSAATRDTGAGTGWKG
jgi:hypothetical protein